MGYTVHVLLGYSIFFIQYFYQKFRIQNKVIVKNKNDQGKNIQSNSKFIINGACFQKLFIIDHRSENDVKE